MLYSIYKAIYKVLYVLVPDNLKEKSISDDIYAYQHTSYDLVFSSINMWLKHINEYR